MDCRVLRFFDKHEPPRLLRHDVDRHAERALRMARLESEYGVASSYYFRSKTFDVETCDEIGSMGHEIGFHYESLSEAKGEHDKAIELFSQSLDRMRENFDIKTIAMHGSPLSKHDNRRLWGVYDYREYGIIGDASLDVDDSYVYITDTGGSWDSRHNLRDRMGVQDIRIESDDQLIRLLKSGQRVYLSTHPERWSDNRIERIGIATKDAAFNTSKTLIRMIRGM